MSACVEHVRRIAPLDFVLFERAKALFGRGQALAAATPGYGTNGCSGRAKRRAAIAAAKATGTAVAHASKYAVSKSRSRGPNSGDALATPLLQ